MKTATVTVFCEQTGFRSHCKETDYTPLSFASRPDSGRIAKKQIIHRCPLRADLIPVALQRNGLYTTVFFASRPDSGRIAKKQIIYRCPLQADLIPVALQRNRLYTAVLCEQT
jgi:hypothetical protein